MALEQPEPGYNFARVVHCALYRRSKSWSDFRLPGKAREESASSPDDEATAPSTRANEEQLEEQGAKNTLADSSALEEPEDALGKDEAA